MTSGADTARKTFVITLVAVLTIAAALGLWKLKLVIALLFLSIMFASAMRPNVENLARYGVPRLVSILAHYAILFGLLGLLLWFVIPNLLSEVERAVGDVPQTRAQLREAARGSTGIKHDILMGLQNELKSVPKAGDLVHPAIDLSRKAIEILVGIFFVLACAVYWIYDRERVQRLVISFVPKAKRNTVCNTWDLVELKLGAYVRVQVLMICFVGSVLSFCFWQIGLPYWLLLGMFAGIVEIVPVIGPLLAGVAAIGVALTVSVEAAVLTAISVYGLRLLQDYVIGPKFVGSTVGLAPLAILVIVSAFGILFGPALVPLATPFTAVVATIIDILVRGKEPKQEEVPRVLLPSQPLGEYQEETERKARKRPARRRARTT
jgi:predicted PurR-regulated permease PerM